LQESGLKYRAQALKGGGKGPARGLWQFEKGGGVKGVLTHPATKEAATALAQTSVGSTDPGAVWARLEYNDVLACQFARLLLWTDPNPLPLPNQASQLDGWNYYSRNWRPGKPHPDVWHGNWCMAIEESLEESLS
jgi:hypothetical protein